VLHVLLGWLCLVVSRGERRSRGLWLWGWGLLLYAAGLLITIPPFIPFDLRKVARNALLAFAPIACAGGLLDSTGRRLHRGWVTAGFLASVLPIVVNHLSGNFIVLVDLLSPAPLSLLL